MDNRIYSSIKYVKDRITEQNASLFSTKVKRSRKYFDSQIIDGYKTEPHHKNNTYNHSKNGAVQALTLLSKDCLLTFGTNNFVKDTCGHSNTVTPSELHLKLRNNG